MLKTNTDFIFDLVGKTVTCIYNTDKKVIFSAQLVKHKTVSKGHFFEYSFDGCITNGKILISENEDGTYSIIRQFASFDKDITTKGEFDRNVKVVVK